MEMSAELSSLKGIGPKKFALLNKIGLFTIQDFIDYFPRKYIDRRSIVSLGEIKADMTCSIRATVIDFQVSSNYGKKDFLRIKATDGQFFIDILFFNARYVSGLFKHNREYIFYGKVAYGQNGFSMTHPDFTPTAKMSDSFLRVQPVYSLTDGLSQKDMIKISNLIFEQMKIANLLPESIIGKHKLCNREFAISNIHFPKGREEYKIAKYMLVFEEFFTLQLGLLMLKSKVEMKIGNEYHMTKDIKIKIDDFVSKIGYELTNAQKRVLGEVYSDLINDRVMNRLVQGDVGSGKTILAILAMYFAKLNGYQSALMVPTEILAEQHYESFCEMFKNIDIKVALLTRNSKSSILKEQIESGSIDIVIGTHALIQSDVNFKKLGLVVTDEQHRFGVNQRKVLSEKGKDSDVLVMTATPIPRTLSLILYGDIEISRIDEMPANRLPIITSRVYSNKLEQMYDYIRKEIDCGRQCYIVYPLVEESDTLDLKSVTQMYEELSKSEFRGYKTGLIHGKMKSKDKDAAMKAFESNETSILFATTVIEVGINVPNSSIIVIEHAERFGLAQLHQLRGRVGRGSYQSYCFLVSDSNSDLSKERLGIMCKSNNGFEIADKDLEIRGPGEVFGLRQHGLPEFNIADLLKNREILQVAQDSAKEYIKSEAFKTEFEASSVLYKKIDKMFNAFSI